ncbi:MAG: helix-turn-helix transcriptional regulator [Planctomycetales bacterium]|nr:helix-turn-helix transcriptional regulator [Planctomycetales bacterium]
MSRDTLSATFAAIADPTRRAILAQLSRGEAAVTELAEPFAMTLPAITKHLKVLERAGLIERSRCAQRRPCRLRAQPLQEAAAWIERYRATWEESFQKLDAYLTQMQDPPEPPAASTRSEPAASKNNASPKSLPLPEPKSHHPAKKKSKKKGR